MSSAGRVVRPALVLAGLAALGGLLFLGEVGPATSSQNGPVAVPNPEASPPVEVLVGSVRHVYTGGAPERVVVDTSEPRDAVRLLWFEGRPASPLREHEAVTLDGTGGLVVFDGRLRSYRVSLSLEGRVPASVAPGSDRGYWIADTEGGIFLTDSAGRIVASAPPTFDYPAVESDGRGGAWAVRSTSFFAYRLASAEDPLLFRLEAGARMVEGVGSISLPQQVLLADLANSGHIAVASDAVYFAPFIRDEVVALAPTGDTLWVAHRELPQAVDEPRFEVGPDGPMIDYAPVNLGIRLGPDGRLYVLSVPGFTTAVSRIDVFDAATGRLERTGVVPTSLPTLAVSDEGRLHLLDPFRLLTGVSPEEREPFARFELETLAGETIDSGDLLGKVVLVNFWASWCAPCRVEMPALDSLRGSIDRPDFMFLTMNEDASTSAAREFIEEYGFEFPVLLGRGRLRSKYHYVGLPFTVLLDRHGRIVQRWVGFAGEEQLAAIRAVTVAELDREAGEAGHSGGNHGPERRAGGAGGRGSHSH